MTVHPTPAIDAPKPAESRGAERATPSSHATEASSALPGNHRGVPDREATERRLAPRRQSDSRPTTRAATEHPDLPGLGAHRLFTMLGDSVRDYAVFLMDSAGIIRY